MKVSVNSLRVLNREYDSAGDPAPDGVDKLVQKIGAQLGAVEETIQVGKKYEGISIVRVVHCEVHPNANRLQVCQIDDGGVTTHVPRLENGLIQVVCGAPNVVAGVTVAWLPPGATVPATYDTEPFVLESRELRGQMSHGMLASPRELSLADNHEGLLIIDDEVEPGTPFAERYGLNGDVVIDMENKMFTHRPDCFGWLGIAREIAGIQGQAYKSPAWYKVDAPILNATAPVNASLPLTVRNDIPELVPRFMAVPVAGITVAVSPVWLQVELSRVGIRSINNIVDLTNFYMALTGQPLHAYDYDKVVAQDAGASTATLVVRKPEDGEKLTLLNGKEIQPRSEAILIATRDKAIGLGGVMGGHDTEVDRHTKNIILECANFDMYSIRRTSMAHGLFTDAVTRFNKGQSPLQNQAVLAKLLEAVLGICGGQAAGPVVDDNHLPAEVCRRGSLHTDVVITAKFVNERLGLHLKPDDMATLLRNVEFDVKVEKDALTVRAPFWRTDIEIPEDVVEEIGRLFGFDKLPLELPKRTITPAAEDLSLVAKARLRATLSRAGANELMTYSFVHGDLLEKAGQDPGQAFKLTNALSPDLQYYRMSLTPSLLDKVYANAKAGYEEFALFELGKVHGKSEIAEDGLPQEFGRLALVYAAARKKGDSPEGEPYYQALRYLRTVLPGNFLQYELRPLQDVSFDGHVLFGQLARPFEPVRSAVVYVGDKPLGIVGEYRQAVHKALKLPKHTAGFEIFLSYFEKHAGERAAYVPLPRYPKVTQDITLKVGAEHSYRQVYDALWNNLEGREADDLLITLTPLDIFQREDDKEHKQITLRLQIASYEKTMTDTEVNRLLDTAAAAARDALGAERV
ncbi:MAG TPA: phenylalanine--tRNA ligase subunit beta [Candidatus Saccharimonadales bacterium]|nr:phenylalanine--tRNA ligase subunit beta [Candidatus Saccharimonadales bacterium]